MSDFLERESQVQSATALQQVMEQVNVLLALREEIDKKTEELKDLSARELKMRRETVPMLLQSHGLDMLGLEGKRQLTIEEKLAVSVPKEEGPRKIVLNWLDANGASEIIKETVSFEDPDEEIKAILSERGITYTEEKTVNANALASWFRGALGMKKNSVARIDPKNVPKEANLFLYKETKITEAKE